MNLVARSLIACSMILALHGRVQAQGDSGTVASQELEKGSFAFTLNGSGSATNGYQHSSRAWSLTPQAGYLVANRLVVGLLFSMGKKYQRPKSGVSATIALPDYQFYSVLPEIYTRYYLLRFRLKPFAQLSSGYNIQWGKGYTDGKQVSVNAGNLAISGAFGLNFRISKRMGLDALYNTRFDNNSKLVDANENLKYRLGISLFID